MTYELLVANLNRRIVVPSFLGGKPVKGRLIRVGRIGPVITVDLQTKRGLKSLRVA